MTCLYTHEQNEVSEKKIRHVVDYYFTLLADSNVPQRFWKFVILTIVD